MMAGVPKSTVLTGQRGYDRLPNVGSLKTSDMQGAEGVPKEAYIYGR
jgi:hypothetical protein